MQPGRRQSRRWARIKDEIRDTQQEKIEQEVYLIILLCGTFHRCRLLDMRAVPMRSGHGRPLPLTNE